MKGLFITSQPLPMRKYIFCMAFISIVPSLLVAGLIATCGAFGETPGPHIEKTDFGGPILAGLVFIVLVAAGPIVETLMMSLGIWILSLCTTRKVLIAILSAILWAALHALASPAWGLIVCWPFFVFSCAYLAWRQKSWLKAVWVVFCIHALQNLLGALVLLIYLST